MDLEDAIADARELLQLLEAIQRTYDQLPSIGFDDDIYEARELLQTLQQVNREADR